MKPGDTIHMETIEAAGTGELYWFVIPSPDYSFQKDGLPPNATVHGPFKTDDEVRESQRLVLGGQDCVVKHGGMWDPAWNKPQ